MPSSLGFRRMVPDGGWSLAKRRSGLMRAARRAAGYETQFSWAELPHRRCRSLVRLADAEARRVVRTSCLFPLHPPHRCRAPAAARRLRDDLRDFADFIDTDPDPPRPAFRSGGTVELSPTTLLDGTAPRGPRPRALLGADRRRRPFGCGNAAFVQCRRGPALRSVWLDPDGPAAEFSIWSTRWGSRVPRHLGTAIREAGRGWGALLASPASSRPAQPGRGAVITEAGYSTWSHDELRTGAEVSRARRGAGGTALLYAWRDIAPAWAVQEGQLVRPAPLPHGRGDAADRPETSGPLLTEGWVSGGHAASRTGPGPCSAGRAPSVVITGGCGFIGSEPRRQSSRGPATSFSSRRTTYAAEGRPERSKWLREPRGRAAVHVADIRHPRSAPPGLADARALFHLAGQTAVTTSLAPPPVGRFEIKRTRHAPTCSSASRARRAGDAGRLRLGPTSGLLGDLAESNRRLEALARSSYTGRRRRPARPFGIRGRTGRSDFHTPYGCIEGPSPTRKYWTTPALRHCGRPSLRNELRLRTPQSRDGGYQGVGFAHFSAAGAAGRKPSTLFGDGGSPRSANPATVSDAVAALPRGARRHRGVSGRAFNLGDGRTLTVA